MAASTALSTASNPTQVSAQLPLLLFFFFVQRISFPLTCFAV
jgi:hypothetical protein